MNLIRLSELLSIKYKIASSAPTQSYIRKSLNSLWVILDKHNIIRECAEADVSKVKGNYEKQALAGFQFCQAVTTAVDHLQANIHTISFGEIRESLINLVKLISYNKDIRFNSNGTVKIKDINELPEPEIVEQQFPHVSAVIMAVLPHGTHRERSERGKQYGKARTGLSRILSLSLTILDDIKKLEVMEPELFTYKNITDIDINEGLPDRIKPVRGTLSIYEINTFLNSNEAEKYGLNSKKDWSIALKDNFPLSQKMTTVINAIRRGRRPKDKESAIRELKEIIDQNNDSVFNRSTNEYALHKPDPEVQLNPLLDADPLLQAANPIEQNPILQVQPRNMMSLIEQKEMMRKQQQIAKDEKEALEFASDVRRRRDAADKDKLINKYSKLSFEQFMRLGNK